MKLLQKTVRGYLIYSAFILLVAIPVFYFTIQQVLLNETDEALLTSKTSLKSRLEKVLPDLGAIHFIDDNTRLVATSSMTVRDTMYTLEVFDSIEHEVIPYRFLESNIFINNKPYLLTRKVSLIENDDLLKSILYIQIILLIVLLIGLFIINRGLSIKIWQPFYDTLGKLRAFRVEKDATFNLQTSSVNEFNDLNASLESLARRTHHSFISQKEFTENASHEMQTPLAILQGKLELLMQTTPLNEEQAILIEELGNAAQRMTRLNRSLILLTKIENNQFQDIETVSVNKTIEYFINQYEELIDQKEILLVKDIDTDVLLNANRMLIEVLISNLLGNAIRHNYTGGRMEIITSLTTLTIKNSGKPDALDESKVFNRFQKDGTDSNSIGLGLEIVRKICNLYHYEVAYNFENSLHVFSIRFK